MKCYMSGPAGWRDGIPRHAEAEAAQFAYAEAERIIREVEGGSRPDSIMTCHACITPDWQLTLGSAGRTLEPHPYEALARTLTRFLKLDSL